MLKELEKVTGNGDTTTQPLVNCRKLLLPLEVGEQKEKQNYPELLIVVFAVGVAEALLLPWESLPPPLSRKPGTNSIMLLQESRRLNAASAATLSANAAEVHRHSCDLP